ncbi:MAG: hypothetical protein ACKVJ7_07805, partial [Candidatus Poseidoniales archaeon]
MYFATLSRREGVPALICPAATLARCGFLTCNRWVQQWRASGANMRSTNVRAGMLVFIMFSATFAGCFGEGEDSSLPDSESLSIEVEGGSTNNSMTIPGGEWVSTTFKADADMSVFVPYFLQDPGSLRAQNGTVLDLRSGEKITLKVLFPPRNDDAVLLIGDYGRENWPIRAADESWMMWLKDMSRGSAIMASANEDAGGVLPWIVPANDSDGAVVVKHLSTVRDQRDDLSEENGV